MTGKLTTVLAKKEAETYLAQGLHQDAIDLFDRLLAGSPHIDPAIKAAVQNQIARIRQAQQAADSQRQRSLTAAEIGRIRDGWGDQATETDILVCAQAFHRIGAHSEALVEFKKLYAKAGLKKMYVHAMAECLVALHPPEKIPQAVEDLARELGSDPKTSLAVQTAMAEHMAAGHHAGHARAVLQHLARTPELTAAMQARIADLDACRGQHPIAAQTAQEKDPSPDRPRHRFRSGWLRHFFGKVRTDV